MCQNQSRVSPGILPIFFFCSSCSAFWIFFLKVGIFFFFSLNGGIQSLDEINTCKNAF